MKQKSCVNCKELFDCIQYINGERINCYSRKFCFTCSPYGSHNTRQYISTSRPAYIDSLSLEEFTNIIKSCFSRKEFFRKINMLSSGASFRILNRRIKKDNVDISHFKSPQSFVKLTGKQSYDQILVENSTYVTTSSLKHRLVKDGLLEYKCSKCGNDGNHMDEPLSLHLDHINGVRNDHRLSNLRILCPNCHSQTKTYSGKNKNGRR